MYVCMYTYVCIYIGGCCGLVVCSTAPPIWNYLYIISGSIYKKQHFCYRISRVSCNFHDLCSKYEECIDLIANVEGTHQTYMQGTHP